jgi:hypothetical protein
MRIDPLIKETENLFQHLTGVEKKARKVAILVAFVGVFIWMFKIIF